MFILLKVATVTFPCLLCQMSLMRSIATHHSACGDVRRSTLYQMVQASVESEIAGPMCNNLKQFQLVMYSVLPGVPTEQIRVAARAWKLAAADDSKASTACAFWRSALHMQTEAAQHVMRLGDSSFWNLADMPGLWAGMRCPRNPFMSACR